MATLSKSGGETVHSSKWWMAADIFLFVLGMYVLSSPGRIDLIDCQVRFRTGFNPGGAQNVIANLELAEV